MSVTVETSQDPIGPSGPLEQSVNNCRHSLMAALSLSLDFGTYPVAGYCCRNHTVGFRGRAKIMSGVRVGRVSQGQAHGKRSD